MQDARTNFKAQTLTMPVPGEKGLDENASIEEIVSIALEGKVLSKPAAILFYTGENLGSRDAPSRNYYYSKQAKAEFQKDGNFMLDKGLCMALKNFFETFVIDVSTASGPTGFKKLDHKKVPLFVMTDRNALVVAQAGGSGKKVTGKMMISALERGCKVLDVELRKSKDKEVRKQRLDFGKRLKQSLKILDEIVKWSKLIDVYNLTLKSGSNSNASLEAKIRKAQKNLDKWLEKESTVWDFDFEVLAGPESGASPSMP